MVYKKLPFPLTLLFICTNLKRQARGIMKGRLWMPTGNDISPVQSFQIRTKDHSSHLKFRLACGDFGYNEKKKNGTNYCSTITCHSIRFRPNR
jgi:hypothetical protein